MEKVRVIIELGREQTYFAYTSDWKYITSYAEGTTAEEAKSNLLQAIEEIRQTWQEEGEAEQLNYLAQISIEYSYDIRSFLKHYKLLNLSQVAKRLGVNDVLMRQYKTGQYMSEARAQEIVHGLNEIGRELTAIHL